ncbi:MAG TPA: DUF992 domain-containing protein [Beijerinckiaceae bacterium]|jgi:hypothetical protein|nr:hypothetical protein [Microvirga sp.]HZB38208.1 DUF992 domain-containing protein [Beijerinckiaceae bacterium]
MGFRKAIVAGAAALAGLLAAGTAQAQNVQVGVLQCDVSGGVGLIIASQKELICNFRNSRGEYEVYTGAIRKFGLDVGATVGGQMVWSVFAPSGAVSRGALAGVYVGATAEATVGAGVGANVLVGGSDRSIALQPLSVQGQAGLNVAVGVADLILVAAPPPRERPMRQRRG